MFASGQIVSQKLLASDEAGSFLEAGNDWSSWSDELGDYMCGVYKCEPSMLGNGVCDEACKSFYCKFDRGDCPPYDGCYDNGCTKETHGDGECQEECHILECEWDKGDCVW
jgi:UDP-N-acetylglucosamine-lysosomal-enzyme